MKDLFNSLLDAIRAAGTIMTEHELLELAYGPYGRVEWVEDAEGNVVDSRRVCTMEGLQEIADIYTDDFDVVNY